jgi:ribosomal protein L40E
MISGIFLALVLIWWAVEWFQGRREEQQETARRARVLALRQQYVGLRPDDPVAQEKLGDALREAGFPEEAIAAYSTAERLHAGKPTGANLASKIRLTRLAASEKARPELSRQTLQTRESVCRRCGTLNLPTVEVCAHCGAALLVSGFWETTTRGGKMRGELLREVWPLLGKAALVMLSVACASFLPWEVRGAVLIAAVIVVPIVMLKQLGDPTLE